MEPLGLKAWYYGHAATGLLHVRPVLDLHEAKRSEEVPTGADQTSALVRQFKGSLSAEHGVGIARTEYMREQLGETLLEVMRRDQTHVRSEEHLQSGQDLDRRTLRIDDHLRENFQSRSSCRSSRCLAFAFKDHSFIGNLEQCNGCGGCRKDAPMMCPTFLATGDEVMSTRGRANTIRAALELRMRGHDPLDRQELDAALSNCLSCKGALRNVRRT